MDPLQYVGCQFNEQGRIYTYHNNGETLKVGDRARVEGRGGGEAIVTVCSLITEAPPFETKPILGKVEETQENDNAE